MEVYANQQSPNRERLNKFRSINQHKYFFNFVTMANENVGPSIFIGAAYTSSGKIVEIVS